MAFFFLEQRFNKLFEYIYFFRTAINYICKKKERNLFGTYLLPKNFAIEQFTTEKNLIFSQKFPTCCLNFLLHKIKSRINIVTNFHVEQNKRKKTFEYFFS